MLQTLLYFGWLVEVQSSLEEVLVMVMGLEYSLVMVEEYSLVVGLECSWLMAPEYFLEML